MLPPEKQDPRLMRQMFGAIAPRYDFVTKAFSYGMDRGWKSAVVDGAGLEPGALLLDLACGTGDFSRLAARRLPRARIVAADLTERMALLARRHGIRRVVCADAMRLPFSDAAFDAVFVGYGVRNFPQSAPALAEIRRVLRPGGVLAVLDFFLPVNPALRRLYLAWLWAQGAFWGLLLHGRPRLYTYIPDSLRGFLTVAEFEALLRRSGYCRVRARAFLFGGIALLWAARE